MIFDTEFILEGKNISRWTSLGNHTKNIQQISAVIRQLPVTFGDDEYDTIWYKYDMPDPYYAYFFRIMDAQTLLWSWRWDVSATFLLPDQHIWIDGYGN
jgi:hypothetical protein